MSDNTQEKPVGALTTINQIHTIVLETKEKVSNLSFIPAKLEKLSARLRNAELAIAAMFVVHGITLNWINNVLGSGK